MQTFENKEQLPEYLRAELLNTAEAAELLDYSRQYIAQLVAAEKLIPVKKSSMETIFWREDLLRLKK